MDESALERYFDKYIANDPDPDLEDLDCDIFSLPDELLPPVQGDAADKESSTRLDHSSQNPTAAAELPGGTSLTPLTPETPEIQQPDSLPEIRNVVSMVNLGCFLDLNAIAHKARNVAYKPEVFRGLTIRIRKPLTTAMFFSSGKMVCLGARRQQDSYLASRRFARIVQQLGFPVRFLDFKIVNIVADCWLRPLRLELLAQHPLSSYEPELFPALFLKGIHGVTATVFSTGTILLSGARSEDRVHLVFNTVRSILNRFRSP